jgi:hypothetical protein
LISERVLASGALLLLAGCKVEEVAIPRTESHVAMHAVLSATAPSQVMLLERTRNGSVTIVAPPFELENPFVNDPGIIEAGATATLAMPNDATIVAVEDRTPGGAGTGVYRFAIAGSQLQRNVVYRLAVVTARGERVSAETSVPGGAAAESSVPRSFDRSVDTISLAWPASPGARSYLVRIETPFGPRAFFTADTSVRLNGELRNADISSLRRVFIPGFPQAVTVSAVDSNFYDWYRTSNDELSGSGLINRVEGGLGVFGALVRLRFEDVAVTAPQRDAQSGKFNLIGTPLELAAAPFSSIELYVESRAARSDQADALSGRYTRVMRLGDIGCPVCGLLGSSKGRQIELALLREWSASDTVDVFTGEIHGDTITGRYRVRGGIPRFVRAR